MKLLLFYTSQQGGFTAGTCCLMAEFHCMGFSRSLKGLLRKLASSKCYSVAVKRIEAAIGSGLFTRLFS